MMEELLPPLPPNFAQYEEAFHEVARKVMLSLRFVLLPVVVPGPDLARALGQWLSSAGYQVTMLDLIGAAEWERLAGDLLHVSAPRDGIVMVIGRATPPPGVTEALGLVNQARDAIAKKIDRPLLWCGPWSFINFTWAWAHDLYSVAAVPVTLKPAVPPLPEEASVDVTLTPAHGLELHIPKREPAGKAPSEAPPRSDQSAAAVLAARDAEAALKRGDALGALRIADEHLARLSPAQAELRSRLAVLRARALSRLGAEEQAAAELRALLAAPGLPPDVEIDALLERGEIKLRQGAVRKANGQKAQAFAEKAERYFQKAQALAEKASSPERKVRVCIGLGRTAAHLHHAEEAFNHLKHALAEAEALEDEELMRAARQALSEAHDINYDSKTSTDMTGRPLVGQAKVYKLFEAAATLGLSRDALLAGIPPRVIASLEVHQGLHDQLLNDLYALDRAPAYGDGPRPLVTWLRNATSLCKEIPHAGIFRETLAKLGEAVPASERAQSVSMGPQAAPNPVVLRAQSVSMGPQAAPNPGALAPAPAPPGSERSAAPAAPASAAAPAAPAPKSAPASDRRQSNASSAKSASIVTPIPGASRVPLTVILASDMDRHVVAAVYKHIVPLLRAALTRWWSPDQIAAGVPFESAMTENVAASDVVLVLVSEDLLGSPMMRWVELALQLKKRVVPVLVGPVSLSETVFAGLAPLPPDGRPLSTTKSMDSALKEVGNALGRLYAEMKGSKEQI